MKQALVRLIVFFVSCSTLYSLVIPLHYAWPLPTLDELLSNGERLEIPVQKSQLVRSDTAATRVSVVATDVADVQILDPKQLLINGKSVGQTSLIIWTQDGQTRTIDVLVRWDTEEIRRVIHKILPEEPIEVIAVDDSVALRGQVSDISRVDQAMQIAQSFVPKVINLLTVPGNHQVLLQVRIGEVSRSFRDERGINLLIDDKSFVGGSTLGGLISGTMSNSGVSISDSVTQFFTLPKAHVGAFLQSLRERGLLQILAEPNLIARSGETASFLAGGEFPIPVAQGGLSNAITVEYKEFGVRLNFTPTVVSRDIIYLDISPEVSDLDFAQGVELQGFVIPALVTRRAHTVVKLGDGQTFAIAGLISQTKEKSSRKSPPFSQIPVLGNLFRNRELRGKETELLIMVTPHLIAPLQRGEDYEMPTDRTDFSEEDGSFEKQTARTSTEEAVVDPGKMAGSATEQPDNMKRRMATQVPYSPQRRASKKSVSNSSVREEDLLAGKGIASVEY